MKPNPRLIQIDENLVEEISYKLLKEAARMAKERSNRSKTYSFETENVRGEPVQFKVKFKKSGSDRYVYNTAILGGAYVPVDSTIVVKYHPKTGKRIFESGNTDRVNGFFSDIYSVIEHELTHVVDIFSLSSVHASRKKRKKDIDLNYANSAHEVRAYARNAASYAYAILKNNPSRSVEEAIEMSLHHHREVFSVLTPENKKLFQQYIFRYLSDMGMLKGVGDDPLLALDKSLARTARHVHAKEVLSKAQPAPKKKTTKKTAKKSKKEEDWKQTEMFRNGLLKLFRREPEFDMGSFKSTPYVRNTLLGVASAVQLRSRRNPLLSASAGFFKACWRGPGSNYSFVFNRAALLDSGVPENEIFEFGMFELLQEMVDYIYISDHYTKDQRHELISALDEIQKLVEDWEHILSNASM